jgi:hypothetical protein
MFSPGRGAAFFNFLSKLAPGSASESNPPRRACLADHDGVWSPWDRRVPIYADVQEQGGIRSVFGGWSREVVEGRWGGDEVDCSTRWTEMLTGGGIYSVFFFSVV